MPYKPQIGLSVGLEFEVGNLTEQGARNLVERSSQLRNWQIHHDGSTQKPAYQIIGLPYTVTNYRTYSGGSPAVAARVTTGSEIVSPILDTGQSRWYDQVCYLLDWLRDVAHERPGTYTSTHVHVSAGGLPLYVIKNLLRIWSFLEAPIYRLSVGELGYHRGKVRKEYAYCRPLSSPLIIFDQNGGMRHSFHVPNLLKAESLEGFFLGYGATDPLHDPIRYHPARYCAFNLLPLLTLGTVELRTPNETTDPRLVMLWVELAKALVTTALTTKGLTDDAYPTLPLGYSGDFDIGMMQTLLELSDQTMANLDRVWNMAGWCEFSGVPLFNSNNENTTLVFNSLSAPTVPPLIDGTSVMMYAQAGAGRNSETEVYVFHNRSSYVTATRNGTVSEEVGRDMVLANFRQEEADHITEEPTPIRPEPRLESDSDRRERSRISRPSLRYETNNIYGSAGHRIEVSADDQQRIAEAVAQLRERQRRNNLDPTTTSSSPEINNVTASIPSMPSFSWDEPPTDRPMTSTFAEAAREFAQATSEVAYSTPAQVPPGLTFEEIRPSDLSGSWNETFQHVPEEDPVLEPEEWDFDPDPVNEDEDHEEEEPHPSI